MPAPTPASAPPVDDRALEQLLDVGVEVADTEAEGPGRRYAIWVQGCPMRCPGCCNPELLRFGGGTPTSVAQLLERILAAHARSPLDGVSLLGGEPFAQAPALATLAEHVRGAGLSVMIYSGFTLAELEAQIAGAPADNPADKATDTLTGKAASIARLLAATDLLVDGRYVREQPDQSRRWIGSRNQQLHFLSARHQPTETCFHEGESIEMRLVDGELIINGWPWGKGLPPSRTPNTEDRDEP